MFRQGVEKLVCFIAVDVRLRAFDFSCACYKTTRDRQRIWLPSYKPSMNSRAVVMSRDHAIHLGTVDQSTLVLNLDLPLHDHQIPFFCAVERTDRHSFSSQFHVASLSPVRDIIRKHHLDP